MTCPPVPDATAPSPNPVGHRPSQRADHCRFAFGEPAARLGGTR
jgi:hypothetical protein